MAVLVLADPVSRLMLGPDVLDGWGPFVLIGLGASLIATMLVASALSLAVRLAFNLMFGSRTE